MKPGTVTVVSAGTKQGIFRPQLRLYYQNKRHGTVFETLTKPYRCRTRARAIELGREWRESPEGKEAIALLIERLSSDPDNILCEVDE